MIKNIKLKMKDHIFHIKDNDLSFIIRIGAVSTSFDLIKKSDVIILCLPTHLKKIKNQIYLICLMQ